ncbi:MAG: acyl carrier protein [Campylobacterales bacterium]|nr:acyl carrier protein [Campylobacterales bacterium]
MTPTEKIRTIFAQSLGIDPSRVHDDLRYNTIDEWDSVAHMSLIAALEEGFDIMLDTDEIINMSSLKAAYEILRAHGVAC